MLLSVALFLLLAPILAGVGIDRRLPYFPIELSRILASGPAAEWTFRGGLVALVLLHAAEEGAWFLLGALAVLGISVFDDVQWYALHMTCLWAAFAAVGWRVWAESERLYYFLGALLLYGLRLVLVVPAVAWFEMDDVWWREEPATWERDFQTASALWHHKQALAYGTATPKSVWTRRALQLGGLIQWATFCVMALAVQ